MLQETQLPPILRWARAGFVLLTALAVIVLILAVPGFLSRRPMGDVAGHLVFEPTPFMLLVHRLNLTGSFLAALLSFGMAWVLFYKAKTDGMALFVAFYLIQHGLLFGGTVEMLEPLWPDAAAVTSFILLPMISFPMTVALFAIFPDGQFTPHWTKWVWPFSFFLVLLTAIRLMPDAYNQDEEQIRRLIILAYGGLGVIMLAMLHAQIYRFRHVSTGQQKQQTKWVLYGFAIMVGLFAAASGPWEYARALPPGTLMPWWLPLVESAWILTVLAVPVALTISLLYYRLYDVDILINRTLVYGALSGVIVGLYIFIVGGLGMLLQASGNLVLSLVATGLVAVLFNPLRQRLQNGVNRSLYGDREEPFTVLRQLGQRLESSAMPEDLLDGIVETLVQTLKLPYAEITVHRGDEIEHLASFGIASNQLEAFPIHHQGSQIGLLNVARRSPDEALGETDRRLLRQIATQAGPIVHTVQLTRDLRQSRARIVMTRERERSRLHRDLHDGLGPVLASQGLKIAAVRHLLEDDPERALTILDELASQNEAVVAEIRRLVYALRPPELDELGMVEAVRDFAAGLNVGKGSGTRFEVRAPQFDGTQSDLPAAVEVSAYRIATEALTNVTRHASARDCTVRFFIREGDYGNELCLEVVDDGKGIPNEEKMGIGLNSMKERAEEIGGRFLIESNPNRGTRLFVNFPLTG